MNRLIPHRFAVALTAAALLALPACSSLGSKPAAHAVGARHASDPFAGVWTGRWTSAKHHQPLSSRPESGALRCEFTPLDARHYRAHFTAGWLAFSSSFTATFETQRHGKELKLHGDHNLGALFGGVYHYQGNVTPQRFTAAYSSGYDHGIFEMTRPKQDQ